MAEAAADYLSTCLQKSGGKVRQAAQLAGLNRQHFYEVCARYGVPIAPTRPTPNNPTANMLKIWRAR